MTISNRKFQHPPLFFDNNELTNVTQHKHLGLTFTANLSWSLHVSEIVNSASKCGQVLRCFMYQIDRKSLETIYFTFIQPKLEYACQVWDDCNQGDKEALERVQHNAARIVTGAKKGTSHIYLNQELKWQSLSERKNNVKLQQMHRMAPSRVKCHAGRYQRDLN